ncbi:MAG: AbrB/MazE/SpoVT family DNA-binding domain-containing protein [Vulcanimicrobiota bacterium]
MVKRLTRHGNSYALLIEKPVLELLGFQPDMPLEIVTDGKALIIRPLAQASPHGQFFEALDEVNQRHGEALRRLAE